MPTSSGSSYSKALTCFAVAVVLLTFRPALGDAQERRPVQANSDAVEIIGHIGGLLSGLGRAEDDLLVAAGASVLRLHVESSHPTARIVDRLYFSDVVLGISTTSRLAAVAIEGDGVAIVSIADQNMSVLHRLPYENGVVDVALVDDIVYVAADQAIDVHRVAENGSSVHLKRIDIPHRVVRGEDLIVDGRWMALAAQKTGLLLYDISVPSQPTLDSWLEGDIVGAAMASDRVCTFIRDDVFDPSIGESPWYLRCYRHDGSGLVQITDDLNFQEPILDLLTLEDGIALRFSSHLGIVKENPDGRLEVARTIELPSEVISTSRDASWFRPDRMLADESTLLVAFNSHDVQLDGNTSGILSVDLQSVEGRAVPVWGRNEPADAALVRYDDSRHVLGVLDGWSYGMRLFEVEIGRGLQPIGRVDIDAHESIMDFDIRDGTIATVDFTHRVSLYGTGVDGVTSLIGRTEVPGVTLLRLTDQGLLLAVSGSSEVPELRHQIIQLSTSAQAPLAEVQRLSVCNSQIRDIAASGDQIAIACRADGIVLVGADVEGRFSISESIANPAYSIGVIIDADEVYSLTRFPTPDEERDLQVLPIYGGIRRFHLGLRPPAAELGVARVRLGRQRGIGNEWDIAVNRSQVAIVAEERAVRFFDLESDGGVREGMTVPLPGVAASLASGRSMLFVASHEAGVAVLRWEPDDLEHRERAPLFLPFAIRPR